MSDRCGRGTNRPVLILSVALISVVSALAAIYPSVRRRSPAAVRRHAP